MGGFPNEYYRANQTGIDFPLTDLDVVAVTFLDVAEVSRDEETIRRNHNNARTAHDAVVHLLGTFAPEADQRQAINAKVALLKHACKLWVIRSG